MNHGEAPRASRCPSCQARGGRPEPCGTIRAAGRAGFPRIRYASRLLPRSSSVLVRSRHHDAGREGTHLRQRCRLSRHRPGASTFGILADRHSGVLARVGPHQTVRVATVHVPLPARQRLSHPVQHARALDVWCAAGAAMGHAIFLAVLLRRGRRGRGRHARGITAPRFLSARPRTSCRRSAHQEQCTDCSWRSPCTIPKLRFCSS